MKKYTSPMLWPLLKNDNNIKNFKDLEEQGLKDGTIVSLI
jgi:hypothetical protein